MTAPGTRARLDPECGAHLFHRRIEPVPDRLGVFAEETRQAFFAPLRGVDRNAVCPMQDCGFAVPGILDRLERPAQLPVLVTEGESV